MKIAVSSRGTNLDDEVDPRFGRAAYILIINTDTMDCEALDNSSNVNAFKGAGIQAATSVNDKGAQVLMTGYCGPKAFQVLDSAGIKVVNDTTGTIRDAVTRFKEGQVEYATSANADSHW